jgi:uncharacterized protein (DUF952 family)
MIYHCASPEDWAARSETHYQPTAYADEGFVHLSSAEQMVGTLNKHYPGRTDLLVLTINPALLTTPAVWEDLYGSGSEFPHVYAPLDVAAVAAVTPASCDEDGRWDHWRPAAG